MSRAFSPITITPERPFVGGGGAALDHYAPMVYLESGLSAEQQQIRLAQLGYEPGGKKALGPEDWSRVEAINRDPNTYRAVGGNVMNVLTELSLHGELPTRYVGVIGDDDLASQAIRNHMRAARIGDAAVSDPGYQPSVSIVDRIPGFSRMISGLPRGPKDPADARRTMHDFMDTAYVAGQVKNAGFVVVASLKDNQLNQAFFEHTPTGTPISFNPGSDEFKTDAHNLVNLMRYRNPDQLALNEEELGRLYHIDMKGASPKQVRQLAERASGELAVRVICTADTAGFTIAENGDSIWYQPQLVPKDQVVDTTGAGDNAHANAILGMVHGEHPDQIAERIAARTAIKVQHLGATGHLDHLRQAA